MNIIYIHGVNFPSSAASTVHVAKMCHAYVELGHHVELCFLGSNSALAQAEEIHAHYETRGFETMGFRKKKFFASAYLRALSMVRYARSRRPDMVHSRFAAATFWAALLSLPVIHELHRPIAHHTRLEQIMLRWIVSSGRARFLVVISDALKTEVLKETAALADLFVEHDAADVTAAPALLRDKHFDVTDLNDLQTPRLRIGYVGSFNPGKGVEVVAQLAVSLPDYDFIAAGGDKTDLMKLLPEFEVPQNLVLIGKLDQASVAALLSNVDIALAPYLHRVSVHGDNKADISKYMSPLKLFEYMSAGLPIISSDLPVIREVMKDGWNCILVPPGDLEAWKQAVRYLAENVATRETLSRNGFDLVRQHHTWRSRAKRILDRFGGVKV